LVFHCIYQEFLCVKEERLRRFFKGHDYSLDHLRYRGLSFESEKPKCKELELVLRSDDEEGYGVEGEGGNLHKVEVNQYRVCKLFYLGELGGEDEEGVERTGGREGRVFLNYRLYYFYS
jgi:hypothetical protein